MLIAGIGIGAQVLIVAAFLLVIRDRDASWQRERAGLLDRIQAPEATRAGLWPMPPARPEPVLPPPPRPQTEEERLLAEILGGEP